MIEDIEKKYKYMLPNFYKDFLTNIKGNPEYYFNEDDDPDYDGICWFLYNTKDLIDNIEIKGAGVEPVFSSLRLYVKLFKDFSGEDYAYSDDGDISLERISKGFVIGEENGDYLYIDPEDNNSIWIYYHDGGDVKKISKSFAEWLKKAKKEEID